MGPSAAMLPTTRGWRNSLGLGPESAVISAWKDCNVVKGTTTYLATFMGLMNVDKQSREIYCGRISGFQMNKHQRLVNIHNRSTM